MELFDVWGYRIDPTFFKYLRNPTEAWASSASSPIVLLLCILGLLIAFSIWLYNQLTNKYLPKKTTSSWVPKQSLIWMLLTALLFLPIRGGWQLSPINQSSVYFSNQSFANLAAINAPWNFFSAVINDTYETTNPYHYFSAAQSHCIVDSLYKQPLPFQQLLNTPRPNVLIIIWESLTAKVVERLGGKANVTPHFGEWSKQGLFFDHFFASGDRSDKGLIAILSGYPAQSLTSIMTVPSKTAKLPSIAKDLTQLGYQTSFYYGGEPEFANIKSYLYSSHFQNLITKENFSPNDWNSKWGAHDHVVYQRLLQDLNQAKKPFFTTFFTLSSHEPFEVPMKPYFKEDNKTDGFLNSHRYADYAFDNFLKAAQQQPWWNKTLIIVVADHGHSLPETNSKLDQYKIPMLWLGGALNKKDSVVHQVASQTDIAATLLHQVGLTSTAYVWSRNLFCKQPIPFAYFAFHNGFGWIEPSKELIFDHDGNLITEQKGDGVKAALPKGKAYAQASFQDYLDK
ncbi:MAG: LTA synthase family protein [Spirosomataceae bacterium]